MDRDEFEKLARCVKDDPVCSPEVFKTNETNPYAISADPNLIGILKPQHQMESDRIKLLYDIICDDSMLSFYCFSYFKSTNDLSHW